MRISVFLFFALLAASALRAQPAPLLGLIKDKTYISAHGVFRVPLPVLPEAGGRIVDNENVVTFDDDFRTHLSIAAFPFSRVQRWEFETRGVKDYLIFFFQNFVQPDLQDRFPGSKIESARFVPSIQGGALLVYTLHPGGSYFEPKSALGPPSDPVLAKRGNLCFIHNEHVFIISSELAERATERSTWQKSTEEEDELLRQRLIDIVSGMVFQAPPPSLAR